LIAFLPMPYFTAGPSTALRSERFHVPGVWASVIAFVCFMASMAAGLSIAR